LKRNAEYKNQTKSNTSTGGKTVDSPTNEKSETTSLKSNYNEVVAPEQRETYPERLSGSASADDPETYTTTKVPNNRERKVVAKRKMSDVKETEN
jgi:topoisomerase (DNA) II binding protein 1